MISGESGIPAMTFSTASIGLLVRFDPRQFVRHGLRQITLFQIKHAINLRRNSRRVFFLVSSGSRSSPDRITLSTFQYTTIALSSPLRTCPSSSLAWRRVNQNVETYFEEKVGKRLCRDMALAYKIARQSG